MHSVAPVSVQARREVVLQLHGRHRPGRDVRGVEDMQARQILPGVVHHQQHPPVVLRHRPWPGAEDGLLHEAPLAKVVRLLLRLDAHLGRGVKLDQALVRAPLHVVLHRGTRGVHVPVGLSREARIDLGKLHNAVAKALLFRRAACDVHVEARVLHTRAPVPKCGSDHVEVHSKIHELPGRRVEHDLGGVVAPRRLERIDVVEEELIRQGDSLLADRTGLLGARQHVKQR
mmetsp:Transcript_14488/g.35392  ORF Transcript_14488/g.35392 Transcript_14488/m.35392 type:complete len:230 (-) Transcript_14488:1241-1930(-)